MKVNKSLEKEHRSDILLLNKYMNLLTDLCIYNKLLNNER